jgi:Matrixin/Carboxypeptidase regulatory-like domain
MTRRRAAAVAAALVLSAPALDAYLKLGTRAGANLIALHWSAFPIRYFVTNRDIDGVTAPQLRQAVATALTTWSAVPDVAISSQFVGFTGANPLSGDGMTVIGFQNRPDLDRVLGSTTFTVDTVTGEVLESDIFLNSIFSWSIASGGEAGRQDVESIALHELGHLLGLGHSALGETELFGGGRRVLGAESVMFPIAFPAGTLNRTLRADDVAGLSDVYGNDRFRSSSGSITGRVTKSGIGVLGAHVVAFNPATGKIVGGFSLNADGAFTIAGLEPGHYVLRAEPLDDGDAGSFVDPGTSIDLDFRPAIHTRLVPVPRGGTASGVEVKVTPK